MLRGKRKEERGAGTGGSVCSAQVLSRTEGIFTDGRNVSMEIQVVSSLKWNNRRNAYR